MTVRFKKKRKFRGSRTCGRGSAKRGRGSGEKGGKGMAGGHKQKWTYVVHRMPDYFGKHGFYHPKKELAIINLSELEESLERLVSAGQVEVKEGVYHVDLSRLGIDKLLGSGKVTKPIVVWGGKVSAKAAEKLKAAGGGVEGGET